MKYTLLQKLCLVVMMLGISIVGAQPPVLVDHIAAVVNDEVITQSVLDHHIKILKNKLTTAEVALPQDSVFKTKVLQQLIDKEIQLQMAKNLDIDVSAQELNKVLEHLASEHRLSKEEFYRSVEQEGWTRTEFHQEIRHEIMIQKTQAKVVASQIVITPQEIEHFLKTFKGKEQPSYHIANIVITLPSTPSTQDIHAAEKHAKRVMVTLKKGADFKRIAIQESGGKKALQGGDLGWRKILELPESFVQKIKTMKVGDVEGPIREPNGFHLIKLLGVKEGFHKKMIDETEVQMIFIPNVKSSGTDQTLLFKISRWLKKGQDFNALAKRYSQDKTTAVRGGYVGWTQPKHFPQTVEQALGHLKPGQVSGPLLTTQQGGFIIKVLSRRQVPQTTAAQRKEIRQMIFQRKLDEKITDFISDLRENAYIKIYP